MMTDPHDPSSDTTVRDEGGVQLLLKGICTHKYVVEPDEEEEKYQHFKAMPLLLRNICN